MNPQPQAKNGVRLSGLGDWSHSEYRLGASDTSVGSGRQNDFVIDHATVSRKHAILHHNGDGRYTLSDLNSTNGTFVNGRPIKRTVSVNPGDEIGFGAARFAILGSSAIAPTRRRGSTLTLSLGAAAGIIAFAIAGFFGTRYALKIMRVEGPSARPSPGRESAVRGPVVPPRELTESHEEPPSSPAAAENTDVEAPSPTWLKQLNDFRASVNLAPVSNDEKLSDADHKHAIYVLKNFPTEIRAGNMGPEVHREDSDNSWYTPEGEEAARTSNIAEQGAPPGGKLPNPLDWAIEGWMVAPFHRLPMLSPLLHDVGFGFACEDRMCVALLNVLSGSDPLPRFGTPLEHPIIFPPDGTAIPSRMRALDGEWPNPISGCEGYVPPSGIPLTVQLGPMVEAQLNSFSLTRNEDEVEACGYDANSYYNPDLGERTRVISNLRSQGAVVIIPRRPLEPGTRYQAIATVNGRDYKWAFTIAR